MTAISIKYTILFFFYLTLLKLNSIFFDINTETTRMNSKKLCLFSLFSLFIKDIFAYHSTLDIFVIFPVIDRFLAIINIYKLISCIIGVCFIFKGGNNCHRSYT